MTLRRFGFIQLRTRFLACSSGAIAPSISVTLDWSNERWPKSAAMASVSLSPFLFENVDCAVNAINPRCRADRTLGQIGFLLAVKYRLHLVLSGFLASHCASPRF